MLGECRALNSLIGQSFFRQILIKAIFGMNEQYS